jgi:YfiH family protein
MPAPPDWFAADWPAPPRVRTLFTTRQGGVSQPPFDTMNLGTQVGDDAAAVEQNRARLSGLLPAAPGWMRQVHGTRVVDAAQAALRMEEADACVALSDGQVCAVLVADCLPVMLCDRRGTVVAVAHAGWRGLAAGVLEETVARLAIAPSELLACLGPAIGKDAFEVGRDVLEAFAAREPAMGACFTPKAPGPSGEPKWLGDLPELARRRLRAVGITNVWGGQLCTYSDPARFYSHRRDRRTGRQAALIWLEP